MIEVTRRLFIPILIYSMLTVCSSEVKIKYREAFPPEHEGYLPDSFKQRLREIAQNEYLTGEARIDLVDKVYDKLPKTILVKLPLDPPIYQLPPPTQKKFRALMVDRSLGWRRRAQLYDQLVDSLPKNYRKLIAQFAKSGAKSSSSSESSSTEESGGVNDPEMEAGGANDADMAQAEMSNGSPGGMGSSMGGGMDGGMSGGMADNSPSGLGGQEMVYDTDRSGIDYDKYTSDSSSEEDQKDAKGKPWSSKSQINKKKNTG